MAAESLKPGRNRPRAGIPDGCERECGAGPRGCLSLAAPRYRPLPPFRQGEERIAIFWWETSHPVVAATCWSCRSPWLRASPSRPPRRNLSCRSRGAEEETGRNDAGDIKYAVDPETLQKTIVTN